LDAYRLESTRETEALDIDMLLDQGSLVVEWAQNIETALPAERLWLRLIWSDEERRRIEISPQGERYKPMAAALQETVFGLV
jgi:tRNA A37 threonylcarbamoyladenosine biosynthesis protein TsaE